MSGAQVIILYPRKEGSTFNKDYYVNSHMELAKKVWQKHGFKSFAVTDLNADSPYVCSSVMEFESPESFGKAMQDPDSKQIMDDVKNYTTETPVILYGSVIGRG